MLLLLQTGRGFAPLTHRIAEVMPALIQMPQESLRTARHVKSEGTMKELGEKAQKS